VKPLQPSRTARERLCTALRTSSSTGRSCSRTRWRSRLFGLEAEAELRRGQDWHGHAAPGLRAFIVARSRLTEDLLAEAAGQGTRQYVVLGAGLDTYGYRQSRGRPPLSIFEVDHPATQAWKRARLKEANLAIPANVFHAPVDFEREPLDAGLRSANFDFDRPAFVAWLGVNALPLARCGDGDSGFRGFPPRERQRDRFRLCGAGGCFRPVSPRALRRLVGAGRAGRRAFSAPSSILRLSSAM